MLEPDRPHRLLAEGAPLSTLLPEEDQGLEGRGRRRHTSAGMGSGDLPVQHRQIRRSRSKAVVPIEQLDGSSSDDKETARRGMDPLKAIREYNRRAQQKCRDRQKQKLAMSEGRAQELQRALERMNLEKIALEAHNRVLQELVGLRGDNRQAPQPAPMTSTPNQDSLHEELDEATGAAVTPELGPPAQSMVHLSICRGRSGLRSGNGASTMSSEQLKDMPVGELAALMTNYVRAMGKLLLEARGDASCPAGMRAVQLTMEIRLIVNSLMAANRWSIVRALKLDPGADAPLMESPPPDWWRKVAHAMRLTDGQRRSAIEYRNRMLLRMGETLRARRDIYLTLLRRQQAADPILFVQDPQRGIELAQGLLRASDAAEELRRNIADEQQLHNQFHVTVRATLTPLQSATAIVHSYPWWPEPLAIINCVADEEGAPPAHELLACQAHGGPAWRPTPLPGSLQPAMPQLDVAGA